MPKELLLERINNLPDIPGVYLFYGLNNKIIYIGKAKNLRNRIKSYFTSNDISPKTALMVSKIENVEIIATDNEIEAFILESNLIKQHKPKYNINLKDDKSFPYIVITNEDFPRVYPTRKIIKDGSKYFGPFTDVKSMKSSLRLLRNLFKIRSCKYKIDNEFIQKKKIRVCLDYHIKKCDGCCEGLVEKNSYHRMVKQIEKVLSGRIDNLILELNTELNENINNLQFEKAAEIKSLIDNLSVYAVKQKVVSSTFADEDIVSIAKDIPDAVVSILNIRNGKIVGKKKYLFNYPIELPDHEFISFIINLYLEKNLEIPAKFIFNELPDDIESIKNTILTSTGVNSELLVPSSAEEKDIYKMAFQNALLELNELKLLKLRKESKVDFSLLSLQKDLRLNNIPKRIECFDISHLQGADTVASCVVFENGKPKKSKYRKYLIRTVKGINDFASIFEVVLRHFEQFKETNTPLPELIVIDGGKGQLSNAVKALKKIGFSEYSIIGLAKRLEEIFLPNEKNSLFLPRTSQSLKLLQRIRNEAHRFAITFHKNRRDARTLRSELTDIKGIGEKTANKLLNALGSVEEIRNSEFKDLAAIVGKNNASKIIEFFNK